MNMGEVPFSFCFQIERFVLLRLGIQTIDEMAEDIPRDDIAVYLRATLFVEGALHVRETAEKIEAINHTGETAMAESLRQARVPYQFIGIHLMVRIAAAAVHRQVGKDLEIEREFKLSCQSVIEVSGIHR